MVYFLFIRLVPFQEYIQNNKTVNLGNDIKINCRLNLTTKFFINKNQRLILTHSPITFKWFKDNNKYRINETERIVISSSSISYFFLISFSFLNRNLMEEI